MKKQPLLLLALALCSLAQAQRTGKDYAVFFYVTDFQPGWTSLPETAVEATALQTELSSSYNFTCDLVRNPTKQAIRNKIREYNQRLTPNDQVFFFFSMHGFYTDAGERGYLVASDGKTEDAPYYDSYLSYDELRNDLAPCRAKHILLALDACHSGSFGSRHKGGPDAPIYEKSDDCTTRINNTMQYAGRQYCTSGNKNSKTPAKSVFASRLLEALRKGGESGIVQFDDLEYWVGKVGNPQPESGSFGGHEPSGDFVFVRKYACGNVTVPEPSGTADLAKDLAAWRLARQEDSAESYHRYLQTFPNGEFHELASQGLDKKNREAAQNRDDLAWQVAIEYNNIAAYQRYQREYPQGLHYTEASEKIRQLQVPTAGLSAQSNVGYFTILVCTFSGKRPDNLMSIERLGFLFAKERPNQIFDVYIGGYDTAWDAAKVLDQVKKAGFPAAKIQQYVVRDRQSVASIQIASFAVNEPFNWSRYESLSVDLYVIPTPDGAKLCTGFYPSIEAARKELSKIQAMGYSDAFVRTAHPTFLHQIGGFETGTQPKEVSAIGNVPVNKLVQRPQPTFLPVDYQLKTH